MKYYLFQGRTDKMEDRLFKVLKSIEPTVEELTKEDYENRMGIGPKRPGSKKGKDVRQSVGDSGTIPHSSPVQTDRTKKELVADLVKRGFEAKILNRKTKAQLLEMI